MKNRPTVRSDILTLLVLFDQHSKTTAHFIHCHIWRRRAENLCMCWNQQIFCIYALKCLKWLIISWNSCWFTSFWLSICCSTKQGKHLQKKFTQTKKYVNKLLFLSIIVNVVKCRLFKGPFCSNDLEKFPWPLGDLNISHSITLSTLQSRVAPGLGAYFILCDSL